MDSGLAVVIFINIINMILNIIMSIKHSELDVICKCCELHHNIDLERGRNNQSIELPDE